MTQDQTTTVEELNTWDPHDPDLHEWVHADEPPPNIEVDRVFLTKAYQATLDYLRVMLNGDVTRGYSIGDDSHDDLSSLLSLAEAIRTWYYEDQPECLSWLINRDSGDNDRPDSYDFWCDNLADLACDGVPPFFHNVHAPALWYGPLG